MHLIKINSPESELYETLTRDDRQMAVWIFGLLTELDQEFEKLKETPPEDSLHL